MSTTTLTTELEAINTMLASAGESPVNSLDISGLADVAAARATMDEISREVQSKGWNFNIEHDYPLAQATDMGVTVPGNCLQAVVENTSDAIAQRGLRLYNKTSHSYKFPQGVRATVTLLLPWDELPQVMRHYLMIKASRVFQGRTLGSDTLFRFSQEQEMSALTALKDAEGETGQYNMLSGSRSVMSMLER